MHELVLLSINQRTQFVGPTHRQTETYRQTDPCINRLHLGCMHAMQLKIG